MKSGNATPGSKELVTKQDDCLNKWFRVPVATNIFAVDLHKCLENDDRFVNDKLFYSPSSLLIALAMTSHGARGGQ